MRFNLILTWLVAFLTKDMASKLGMVRIVTSNSSSGQLDVALLEILELPSSETLEHPSLDTLEPLSLETLVIASSKILLEVLLLTSLTRESVKKHYD